MASAMASAASIFASGADAVFWTAYYGDGGPFIKQQHPDKTLSVEEAHFRYHGVHAQNYHIFTPPLGKEWTMVWGCQPWIKDLPYANAAYDFNDAALPHGISYWVRLAEMAMPV